MAAKTDKSKFMTDPYGIIERGVPSGGGGPSFSVGRVGSPVASLVSPGRSFGTGIGAGVKIPVGKDESTEVKKKAKGGKVQTSADTARKLATEMGGMKKGGAKKATKDGLAVMIAIGKTKPVKKAVGGAGKTRKGMCDTPAKYAKGGAGKVRKGMMTPEGKIIDVMNKIRGK